MTETSLAKLAELVGGEVLGDPQLPIRGVADLRMGGPGTIGFLRDASRIELARSSGCAALLVPAPLEGLAAAQVVVRSPDSAFARIASFFHPPPRASRHEVHPSAVVDPGAVLHQPVRIDALVSVAAGAEIGAGSYLGAGVMVGRGVRVGRDCSIHPRVVLADGVRLGDRVVLQPGVVIGGDGFGYAPEPGGSWARIPHVGTVELGDDVEVGANSAIDRATLGVTRIGRGTKIDNLVHIAHNCDFGEDCAIAAFSAFSGSTRVGDRVQIGGHCVSRGHNSVVADARIAGGSVLWDDVDEPGDYMGYPLMSRVHWLRTLHAFRDIAEERGLNRANRRRSAAERSEPEHGDG